uniref:Ig-like domain-containing protein n=1 Tax=Maylandia zebra TaxID=106582 RepID=A0A3P9CNA5_9CICH
NHTFLYSLLPGSQSAVGQTVIYPLTSTCAVRGSTATLRCTFTPLKTFSDGGREVPPELIRVVWYQSQQHQLCQLNKPFVYDSDSKNHKQRFEYLGDKKTNCTLQIRDVHLQSQMKFVILLLDSTKMRIISSSDDKKLSRGETVTLLCASVCTFHQLEVTWFKDGHALSETGPSLELDFLTAEDSGNYTCALKEFFFFFSLFPPLLTVSSPLWFSFFLSPSFSHSFPLSYLLKKKKMTKDELKLCHHVMSHTAVSDISTFTYFCINKKEADTRKTLSQVN